MKKLLLILTVLLTTYSSLSQENKAVKSGEKFIYAASYNMSGLMTQLAQVTMQTETVKTSKNTLLHLSCQATTYSKWDSFFKIRDIYESYVNPITLRPSLYKRDIFEGNTLKKKSIFSKMTARRLKVP